MGGDLRSDPYQDLSGSGDCYAAGTDLSRNTLSSDRKISRESRGIDSGDESRKELMLGDFKLPAPCHYGHRYEGFHPASAVLPHFVRQTAFSPKVPLRLIRLETRSGNKEHLGKLRVTEVVEFGIDA